MGKFIKKLGLFVLFLLLPFLVLVGLYLYFDPFKVVRQYTSFYNSGKPSYVTLNNDYVAMETFLHDDGKYHYNSFIFGNSRSRFYEIDTWKKYIRDAECFHFDASKESLYGIDRKIAFLKSHHVPIKNALVILDNSTLASLTNSSGHLFLKHPLLSGQDKLDFQLEFFKTFCSFNFLRAYLDFKISGKVRGYMKTYYLLDDTPVDYNLEYNEIKFAAFEKMISTNPSAFYTPVKIGYFPPHATIQTYSEKTIYQQQAATLAAIAHIFKEDSTNYKIVINPLYDQVKMNLSDVGVLKKIFGDLNVFDYSGINSITNDYHNYYEPSHYRPMVADAILKEIYGRRE